MGVVATVTPSPNSLATRLKFDSYAEIFADIVLSVVQAQNLTTTHADCRTRSARFIAALMRAHPRRFEAELADP